MNNLQIGDNDKFGNRFNGHDLHLYLNERGIESKHLVWEKHTSDKLTYEIARNDHDKLVNNYIREIEKKQSLHSMFYINAGNLISNKYFLDSDVVHYHLLHNYFLGLPHLPILSKLKPTVWTLHDPWAMTGHCIYPFDCEKWKTGCQACTYLNTPFAIKNDTSSLTWEMKRTYYSVSDFDVIVASKWMYDMAKQSPLLAGKKIHLVPFGLDLARFKPTDTAVEKNKFGISSDTIVLCFRNSSSLFKGFDCVKQALRKLKSNKKICLLTLNEKGNLDEFKGKYQLIELGWVDDEDLLTSAYNAADILLMPSKAEAFGMMAMEAMACGKPSIVFEGTSLPEVMHHPEAGIAVPMGDTDKLYNELDDLIDNDNRRRILGHKALQIAQNKYNKDRYISDIIAVYEEVIDKRKFNQDQIYIIDQLKRNNAVEIEANKSNPGRTIEIDKAMNDLKSFLLYLLKYRFIRFVLLRVFYPLVKLLLKMFRRT